MNTPQFTIITPSYNYARFIRECIESVQSQEGVTFEHLIFDAGSTDGTLEILREYPHLQVTVEPDKGMTDAINKGFKKAQGQWVMWLNTDDRLLPGALKTIAQLATDHPEADVLYGAWNTIRADGTYIRSMKAFPFNIHMLTGYGCYMASTALFIRKKTTVDEGFFLNIRFKNAMDGEYYARLGRAGKKFVSLNRPLAEFRLHSDQISGAGVLFSKQSSKISADEALTEALRRAENIAIRRAYGWTPFKNRYLQLLLPVLDAFIEIYYTLTRCLIRPFIRWK